jgi:hypothetical protein
VFEREKETQVADEVVVFDLIDCDDIRFAGI